MKCRLWSVWAAVAVLSLASSMLGLGCGDGADRSPDSDRGEGGAGGAVAESSCAAPLDYDAHRQYHADIPFVGATVPEGKGVQEGSCGGGGAEQILRWTAPRDGRLELWLARSEPSLTVYVRRQCTAPETEVICGRGDWLLELDVEEGETLYFVVDSEPSEGKAFELAMKFWARALGEGEACRLDLSDGACASGLYCDKKEGRCQVNYPAVLASLQAHPWEEFTFFRVEGSSMSRNVFEIGLRLYDEAGAPILVEGEEETYADIAEQAYGLESFTATVWGTTAPIEGATRVIARLLDTGGGSSNAIEAEILPPPIRVEAEGCDSVPAFGVCAEGLMCPLKKAELLCEVEVAPSIDELSVILVEGDSSWNPTLMTVVGRGEDPNLDVETLLFRLFDEADELIEVEGADGEGWTYLMPNGLPALEGERFEITGYLMPFRAPRVERLLETKRIEVQAIDEVGLRSGSIERPVEVED